MEKNIKDYLKFYIDSARYRYRYIDSPVGEWTVWVMLTPPRYGRVMDDMSVSAIEIELRKLESMTDEELEERQFSGRGHYQGWLNHNQGKLPADDLLWFLKNGFDVFDLIREGLAIEKQPTTLNQGV